MFAPACSLIMLVLACTVAMGQDAGKVGFGYYEHIKREFEFDRTNPFSTIARTRSRNATIVLTFVDSARLPPNASKGTEIARALDVGMDSISRYSTSQWTEHYIFHVRDGSGRPIWQDAFDFALLESAAAKRGGYSPASAPAVFMQLWHRGNLLGELLIASDDKRLNDRESLRVAAIRFLGNSAAGASLLPPAPRGAGSLGQFDNAAFLKNFPARMPLEFLSRYYSLNTVAIITATAAEGPCEALQRHEVAFALRQMRPPDRALSKPVVVANLRVQGDALGDSLRTFMRQPIRHVSASIPKDALLPVTGVYVNGARLNFHSVRQSPEGLKPDQWAASLRAQIVAELSKQGFRERDQEKEVPLATLNELLDLREAELQLTAKCLDAHMRELKRQMQGK